MSAKITTFLYSKYSQSCQQFQKLFDELPKEYKDNFKFEPICVDNEKIRKHILESENINITSVPCLLFAYNDGRVDKFEGADAFKWVEDIHVKVNYQKMQQVIRQQQYQEQLLRQQLLEQKKIIESKEISSIPEEQPEPETQAVKPRKKASAQAPPPPPPPSREPIGHTSIEDIQSDDEGGGIPGSINIGDNYQNDRPSALSQKRDTLMSAAMAMAKSREEQDTSMKRPGLM